MIKLVRAALLPFIAIGIAVFASHGYAKTPPAKPDSGMVDASSRAQIVNALADELIASYVFPDVADTVATALRKKLKDGGYDSVKYADGESTARWTPSKRSILGLAQWKSYRATLPTSR
jgi:hypothetical protein